MISYPASLKAVGGARTGIAPVNLLDVLTLNNDLYLFSDRLISGVPSAIEGNLAISATPPILPIPAGQAVAWSLPTSTENIRAVPGYGVVSNVSLSGANVEMLQSNAFADVEVSVSWTGFEPPLLPPGAVITGIYPVMVATGNGNNTGFHSGFNLDLASSSPGGSDHQATALNGVSGQVSQGSMGTDLTSLADVVIGVVIYTTVPMDPNIQTISVTFVGLAIYYEIPTYGNPGDPEIPASGIPPAEYLPWLMSVPQITFHRSMQTDFGSFVLQNVSGDTLSRDFEKLMRRATLEGAFFIYRLYQPDAEASWLEVHGTLTVEDVGVDTVKLKGVQLINPAQDDTPMFQYCETCQIQWAGRRCGATGSTECEYSFQTCQVPERIFVVLNDFEKNYGESLANVPTKTINRLRKI